MSLNDEQAAQIKSLAENPDLACGCKWSFKAECAIHCPHIHNQLPEQAAIREEREKTVKRVISLIEDLAKRQFYPLQDIPEYKGSNEYRRNGRFTCDMVINEIKKRYRL